VPVQPENVNRLIKENLMTVQHENVNLSRKTL
jgi:hypothetical protein